MSIFIAGSFIVSLLIDLGCLRDLGKGWRGQVLAKFGQSSGKVQANFGPSLGKVRAKFGPSSGKVRAKFGQNSGKVRAKFRRVWAKFEQVRANFRQTSGKHRAKFTCWITLSYCLFFDYHWLPLVTIDLVGDNREFEV